MERPQQQEIARSENVPQVQESREALAEDTLPEDEGNTGRIPPANRQNHHPDAEQDKPEALGGAGHGTGKG